MSANSNVIYLKFYTGLFYLILYLLVYDSAK